MDSKAYPENAPPTNTYQQPPGSSGNMATPNMYGQPPPYEQAYYPTPNQPYPYPPQQGNIENGDIFSWETCLQNKMCRHWLKNISHQYFVGSIFGIILYLIGQPGGFVQTPMNPPHMTQPPMGGGQQQVVIVTNTRWGPSPMIITCPHCSANITTSITSEPGAFAWIFGALLCFVG